MATTSNRSEARAPAKPTNTKPPDIAKASVPDTRAALRVNPETGLALAEVGARHNHIRVFAVIVSGELPCRSARGTVFSRALDIEPLKLQLLAARDDIYIVAAAKAMVDYAQQAIAVRRVINEDYFTPARQNVVNESRA